MMEYNQPSVRQTGQLKALFQACFQEDDQATQLYFRSFLTTDICYTAQENGHIAAALYLLPARISDKGKGLKAHYLFAAATWPQYRKKGIMGELIRFALESAQKKGDCFSVLLPANDGLYAYYAKLGYKTAFAVQYKTLSHAQICAPAQKKSKVTNCSFDNIAQLRFNILIDRKGSVLFDKKHMELVYKIAQIYGGGIFTAECGYVLYFAKKDAVLVTECICKETDTPSLLAAFADHIQAQQYRLRLPVFLHMQGKPQRFGMVKPLCGRAQAFYADCKQAYLGLTLD